MKEKEGYHQEPLYYGYEDGFDTVTKCDDCGRISLYEDAHPVHPCWGCGGEVDEYASGKWVKPVTKWSWSMFRFQVLEEGYWKGRDGKKII